MSDARDFHLVAVTGNSRENAYVFAYMTATHIVVLSRLQNMTASVKERGREGGIEIERQRERERDRDRQRERERQRENCSEKEMNRGEIKWCASH